MYTTIEADIENGQLKGSEVGKLPAHAHVLITLLDKKQGVEQVAYSEKRSLRGALKKFADPRLLSSEQDAWAEAMEHRHEKN